MEFNRKIFFDGIKAHFDATLDAGQVKAIDGLLDGFEQFPQWADPRNIAYALATIFHETAGSFQPVEEGFYLIRYGSKRVRDFQAGLRYAPYFGRGLVQLTWKTNYDRAGKALGIDLVKHPELALDPSIAFQILTHGMFEAWFTKYKLGNFIHGDKCDYVGARRIINGTDRAGLIAGYAQHFEKIVRASSSAADHSPSPEVPEQPATGANADQQAKIPSGEQPSISTGDNIAIEKETQLGFFAKIKLKIAGWFGYFGGVEAAEKYKGDIDSLGLPTGWIKYFLVMGLILFAIWLLYEAVSHLVERYQKRHRTDSLVQANANAPGTVLVVSPDSVDAFQNAGWTVIRRDNVVPPVPEVQS